LRLAVFAWKELFLKQRLRELLRVKGQQVVRLPAEADELNRQTGFLLNRRWSGLILF
jgi:hypothetical protein